MVLMECGCHCRASFSAHVRLKLPFVWSMEARFSAHRGIQKEQVKSRYTPQTIRRKPSTQNRASLMCLSGQPALKVRLAASSKRNGNELAWVVNAAPTAAAVWGERTCEVAGDAAQNARAVSELAFLLHWNVKCAPPLLRSSPCARPPLQMSSAFPNVGGAVEELYD